MALRDVEDGAKVGKKSNISAMGDKGVSKVRRVYKLLIRKAVRKWRISDKTATFAT